MLAAVGADGIGAAAEAGNLLASTVMNCVDGLPVIGVVVVIEVGLPLSVRTAVIVPEAMAIRTFCDVAGGAFWCGFHSDGSNQASNWGPAFQCGLKTSLFKYGRFSIPAIS